MIYFHPTCQVSTNIIATRMFCYAMWKDASSFWTAINSMAVLRDLSKAFDCLPHRLLIAKLKAYGVCSDSCMLMASYFQGRRQRVRIGNYKSEWMELDKGCPQGSLMGPPSLQYIF